MKVAWFKLFFNTTAAIAIFGCFGIAGGIFPMSGTAPTVVAGAMVMFLLCCTYIGVLAFRKQSAK
jgi:hypothetical protein